MTDDRDDYSSFDVEDPSGGAVVIVVMVAIFAILLVAGVASVANWVSHIHFGLAAGGL